MKQIAFTPGEPAGIGFDLFFKIAKRSFDAEFLIFADPNILLHRAQLYGVNLEVDAEHRLWLDRSKTAFKIHPISCPYPEVIGIPRSENASYILKTLSEALSACLQNRCQALVTGPIHKGVINQAGIPFSGHTEFLAQQCRIKDVVMMLISSISHSFNQPASKKLGVTDGMSTTKALRVALATTHLPLKKVPEAITEEHLIKTMTIVHHDLQYYFKIAQPRILICGLNPHAGENGYLGREELEIITPAITKLQQKGFNIIGPFPADTAFTPEKIANNDAILAMYHDQGLPVLKYAGFGNAVNFTLGLPIIRTSVDHGTALEKAGTQEINEGSLLNAISLAIELIL